MYDTCIFDGHNTVGFGSELSWCLVFDPQLQKNICLEATFRYRQGHLYISGFDHFSADKGVSIRRPHTVRRMLGGDTATRTALQHHTEAQTRGLKHSERCRVFRSKLHGVRAGRMGGAYPSLRRQTWLTTDVTRQIPSSRWWGQRQNTRGTLSTSQPGRIALL